MKEGKKRRREKSSRWKGGIAPHRVKLRVNGGRPTYAGQVRQVSTYQGVRAGGGKVCQVALRVPPRQAQHRHLGETGKQLVGCLATRMDG